MGIIELGKRVAGWRSHEERTAALIREVRAYIREHDHPLRDGRKLKLDYEAMVEALKAYDREMKP